MTINQVNLPQKFQNPAIDSMVILTSMILNNHMTINGSYHTFFTTTESHLLQYMVTYDSYHSSNYHHVASIFSLDLLTTDLFCVTVNDFKFICEIIFNFYFYTYHS